jgi:hypothetical protein
VDLERGEAFPAPVGVAHEAQPAAIERDLESAVTALPKRPVENLRPATGERRGVVALQLGADDRVDHAARHVLAPARPGPVPRLGWRRIVEREQGAAGILRVKVSAADLWQIGLPHGTDAERLEAGAIAIEIVALDDQHVAAVAAASLEIALRRGTRIDRRDDFEERVADRHHGVAQAELLHGGVVEGHFDAEHAREVADGGVQVARHDHELAEPHGVNPPGRGGAR